MLRLPWPIFASPDLAATLAARLCECPRRPRRADALVRRVRGFSASVIRTWFRVYHRFQIVGQEHLPGHDDSFVMIANHASHLDVLCLLSALPRESLRRACPLAAGAYFCASLPRLAAATIFVNAIPFGRQSRVRSSMDRCRRLLRERGNKLIIFPEGTRSTDGRVAPFRPGIGSLLAGLDVPAVPCAIDGARRALPKGGIIPRPRKLRLIIGSPRSYARVEPGRDASHAIAHELQHAVEDLLCV